MLSKIAALNKHKDFNLSKNYHEEYQYINLVKDILENGTLEKGRNGNTLVNIGSVMHFKLELNHHLHIVTYNKHYQS